MKLGLLILLPVLVLLAVALLMAKRSKAPQLSAAGETDLMQKAVAKAKADIQKFGWHILMVKGDGTPGFMYTVGLWQSYKKPEILLFAPAEDPSGLQGTFAGIVKRVIQGEALKSGVVISKAFKNHDGAVQNVLPSWFPSFLGTAGAVYGNFDFPAVQLYWPDQRGLFPWQSGFDPDLFRFQPILYQDNLILANVGYDEIQRIVQAGGAKGLEASLADLFVKTDDASKGDLLESWRWRVGSQAELRQVTVFGDLVLKTPDGHIHWLDTGSDTYEDIAKDSEAGGKLTFNAPAIFFHASTLLHFRMLKYLPKEGEVYSWIHSPLLGGQDVADNFEVVPVRVHLSATGQLAQQSAKGGSTPVVEDDDKGIYAVVTNSEKQYSVWPVDREIPAGWKREGKTGTKQECVDYIAKVWVDMRPESLRKKRDEETKGSPTPPKM